MAVSQWLNDSHPRRSPKPGFGSGPTRLRVGPWRLLAVLSLAVLLPVICLGQSSPPFEEVASRVGLRFEHQNGRVGSFYFPEIMGAGVAFFDADGDGDLDVYAVQGGPLAAQRQGVQLPSDRLFLNQLGKDGTFRFVDVTESSGLSAATEYGMGVAVGDVDGDGRADLFLANYGSNQLWRNLGDGRFEDISERSGIRDPRWSVSAAFVDYDRDGDLDLYVANYVVHSFGARVICKSPTGAVSYCGPQNFTAERDQLLRNRGDGTFEDVSAQVLGTAWIEGRGAGLGVATADFDADGWMDIYVANDLAANHLWLNRGLSNSESGARRFSDEALPAGCALSGEGEAQASMGVIAGDLDGDLDVDLFMTHLDRQTNTFYRNEGQGFFADVSLESGLGNPSWTYTGFGTARLDYDLDGQVDLFVTNGRVTEQAARKAAGESYALAEHDQLFRGLGGGRFVEVPLGDLGQAGPEVGRGVAVGDVDNDGDTDLLISNNHGPLRLWINRLEHQKPWLGVLPTVGPGVPAAGVPAAGDPAAGAPAAGAPAIGAEVRVEAAEGRGWAATVTTDGSYASAKDPRLLWTLAGGELPVRARVTWSDGTVEMFELGRTDLGTYRELRRGKGRAADDAGDSPEPTGSSEIQEASSASEGTP